MSKSLVESFEADFSPEKFTDEYQEQLRELIEAKLKKGDAVSTEETFGEQSEDEGGGEVLDLMEALKRSVDKSRGATKKAPAKKAAAKKPATKKPAAKKAAG